MDEVRTFKKHSAYYTAPFPILSQVRTQTHTEYKMRPQNKTISQTGSVIQKKRQSIHILRYKEEPLFLSVIKGTCSAQTNTDLRHIIPRSEVESGHYPAAEWGV